MAFVRFYLCRRTVMEMLRYRGCNVYDSDLNLSLTEFLSEFGPNPDHERLSVCVPLRSKPSKKIVVIFCGTDELRKRNMCGIYAGLPNKASIHQLILVLQSKMNCYARKELEKYPFKVDTFHALTVAARRLLTNVTQQCAGKLESGIKQFLISSMSGDIKSENHQIDCHQVIYHVSHCAPQILSGVVPYLTGGLLTDQLETRLIAVSLVGDLSYLPGSTISEAFQPISPEFLKRLTDKVVDVRMLAVQHVKSCKLQSNPFRAKSQAASCLFELESMQPFLNAIVKPESSSKFLPFVSYAAAIGAAAAAEAMAAGLADPAGADRDDDDDEGVITDDDLEGDADIEMEEGDDDNGDDDGNVGGLGVPVRMVGYGLHDLVTHINVQLLPTAAALDDQVRDELVHHQLPNSVQPPDQYGIRYVVLQGLHQEIGMTLEQMEDQIGWLQVAILLRRIVAQPILNPRWVDVVIFNEQEPPVPHVINQLDITRCDDADDLLIDLNAVLEQEFNILEVEFHSTCIIDLPLHPNDERNLVEVGQIQPWIIAVQRILEIRVTIENNNGPPSPGTEDSMIED